MERTIKAAFVDVDEDQDEGESLIDAETLGGQILREIINESEIFPASPMDEIRLGFTRVVLDNIDGIDPDDLPAGVIFIDPITIAITPDDLPVDVNVEYTIIVTGELNVFVNSYQRHGMLPDVFIGVDPITGDPIMESVPIDAEEMTMTISGVLEVNLVTTFVPVGNMRQDTPEVPFIFESTTTYRLDQIVLTEDMDPLGKLKEDDPELEVMLISSPVVWTVISYESFS
jgi:hypothetical protein